MTRTWILEAGGGALLITTSAAGCTSCVSFVCACGCGDFAGTSSTAHSSAPESCGGADSTPQRQHRNMIPMRTSLFRISHAMCVCSSSRPQSVVRVEWLCAALVFSMAGGAPTARTSNCNHRAHRTRGHAGCPSMKTDPCCWLGPWVPRTACWTILASAELAVLCRNVYRLQYCCGHQCGAASADALITLACVTWIVEDEWPANLR